MILIDLEPLFHQKNTIKNHFFPTNLNNESDRDVTTLTVTLKEILQSYPKVFFFFFQIFALLFL